MNSLQSKELNFLFIEFNIHLILNLLNGLNLSLYDIKHILRQFSIYM